MAREAAIDAELACGLHRELIGELTALCTEYPFREKFAGLLMLALYRSGRRADALEVYAQLDRRLRGEIGIQPGAGLAGLQRRILRDAPDLGAEGAGRAPADAGTQPSLPQPAAAGAGATAEKAVSRQLPAAVRHFTGRAGEIKDLMNLLGEADGPGGTVVISAIDGMAGIGKTALAVHAAHRLADRFPDGQLFLDLHGHTLGYQPRTAGESLDWLLRALGVPPGRIPDDLEERAAHYRARLADTRTLIILDNAAGEAQIRPLLPGTAGCLVLVTSRRKLKALDDAHALALDVLPAPDAIALFRAVSGLGRGPAPDPVLAEIAGLCGGLPLALRIAASLLRHRPAWSVTDLVGVLRDQRHRITALSDGERDLTGIFDLSYDSLAEPERLLLRQLGLVPGPDLDAHAAAALGGLDLRAAQRLLENLVDHNLVTQPTAGRYRLHDLIRLYARAHADQDPAGEREAAVSRLMDYYLHCAQAADRHLARRTVSVEFTVAELPAHRPELATREQAVAWMGAELANLSAAIELCAAGRSPYHAVALPAAMQGYLRIYAPWDHARRLHAIAVDASGLLEDRLALTVGLTDLGAIQGMADDYEGAISSLQRALDLARELGDSQSEANALIELGSIGWLTDDFQNATDNLVRARELTERIGDRTGLVHALSELGTVLRLTGDCPGAGAYLERALDLAGELGDRNQQAIALYGLGHVRQQVGEYPEAIAVLKRSLELFREVGSTLGQTGCLGVLGAVLRRIGDYEGAVDSLKEALELGHDLGDRHGQAVGLLGLGRVRSQTGDYAGADQDLARSLELFHVLGNRQGAANVLDDIGTVRRLTGDHAGSAEAHLEALRLFREVGDPQGAAEALNMYGILLRQTGRPAEARAHHGEALELAGEVDSPLDEADALTGIGECRLDEGEREQGIADLQRALEIYRRLRVPAADEVAARLAGLGGRVPAPETEH
jgi:tetratricopeptide (TPR) repeat protein